MTTIYEEKVENDEEDDEVGENDEEDDEVGENDEEDDEVGENDEVISSPSNSKEHSNNHKKTTLLL
jgi:hypothetical protein